MKFCTKYRKYLISVLFLVGVWAAAPSLSLAKPLALTDALVLYFDFEEPGRSEVLDKSGKGNNGTIVGEPEWADGVVKMGMVFDGNTFIRIPDGNNLKFDDQLTLAFWFRNDDQPFSRWGAIFCICDPSGYSQRLLNLRWGYDEHYLQIVRKNNKDDKLESQYFRVGDSSTPHFYAVAFHGKEIHVYKDGNETAKGTFTLALQNMDKAGNYYFIGNEWLTGTERAVKGMLDEFRIYNRALSAKEIKALYKSYSFSDYPNLIANSSFEISTLPDWPDRWVSEAGYHFGRSDYEIVLDRQVAHTGKTSIRFDMNKVTSDANIFYLKHYFFFPPVEPGDYVLSAYLKTDTPGMKLIMGTADGGGWKTFSITGEWTRYWLPLKYDKRYNRFAGFRLESDRKGRIWMDDVMLSRGNKPIPYRPSPQDSQRYKYIHKQATESEASPDTAGVAVPEANQQLNQLNYMKLNGEFFLPIAVCSPLRGEYDLSDLKSHGVNVILWTLRQPEINSGPGALIRQLDRFQNAGLKVIPDFTYVTRNMPFQDATITEQRVKRRIDIIKNFVRTLKGHRAVLAWHTMDEPGAHNPEMGSHMYLVLMYRAIKDIDPTRPVFCNLDTVSLEKKLTPPDATDVVMYDYYAFPDGPDRRPLYKAQKYLRFARQWGIDTSRPIFTFIELNEGALPNAIRLPTIKELRCRMFVDLVEGSRGLFFFAGPPFSKMLWDGFRDTVQQINALQAAWFNPSPAIRVNPDFAQLRSYVGTLEGKQVIVMVNPTHEEHDVKLALQASRAVGQKVDVMFENRKLPIRDNIIVDHFDGYEVHIYRLSGDKAVQ